MQRLGEAQEHGEAALHVGRAEAVQHAVLDPGHLVARIRGHGVEMAAEHHPLPPTELGAGDHVLPHPAERQRRRPGTQARLDQIGQLGLLVALRTHCDQRGGESEEVGGVRREHGRLHGRRRHVAAPWSRRMSLSFDLS